MNENKKIETCKGKIFNCYKFLYRCLIYCCILLLFDNIYKKIFIKENQKKEKSNTVSSLT